MRAYYLKKAEDNLPPIHTTVITPKTDAQVLSSGDTLTLDLGSHYVGYFRFHMWFVDRYIDAPVKLSVRFCESSRELEDDYSDCQNSWLQEEMIRLDQPGDYRMPRRYAARYIRITVLFSPKQLRLSDFTFEATSSADLSVVSQPEWSDGELERIDRICVNTLKNCMQRVFEDGPKRDRRLWIGDLRLEALANYYTFRNEMLVRRCLYLFAAADCNESGTIVSHLYENPVFVSGDWFLDDYALMYVCSLCDYFAHTKDEVTFRDLFQVAKAVMDAFNARLDAVGIATGDAFIDWCPGLNKRTSLHGVYLYTLDLWCSALETLHMQEADIYRQRLDMGRACALTVLLDSTKDIFVNSIDDRQYSVHSAAWMVLGGVVTGIKAAKILTDSLHTTDSVKPKTPYMHHYVVEALVKAGIPEQAEQYLRTIWGGMASTGCDTFPEIYEAGNPDFSPYSDRRINSMCHAWSCTPTYFIRKYGWGIRK